MGLLSAVFSWGSVKALNATIFWMNLAGIVALVLAIVWAVRLERGFGDYLNLISPGDGHFWTAVIVVAAVGCSPAYFLGVKSYLCLRYESTRSHLEDLDEERVRVHDNVDGHVINRLLFLQTLVCFAVGILVAVLNAAVLVWSSSFQQKSRDGLMKAIEEYGSDVVAKARVDAVQTELECCGGDDYQDWFHVPWLKLSVEGPQDTEDGPRMEGQPVPEEREEPATADVPFSCCSNDIPKPCVHHDILKPSAVYDYNPKRLTIATVGCRSKIRSRAETIRFFLIGYLVLLSVYQMVLSLLSRLLQTAHSNELYIGPQKNRYYVWIFSRTQDTHANRPLLQRKKNDERKTQPKEMLSSQSSLSETSDEKEEPTLPVISRKPTRDDIKILKKIRSKIRSVKSKSLPFVKSSVTFSSDKSHDKKTDARQSDEREDYNLAEPLQEHPTTFHLPPPPPPPPFTTLFDVENEQDKLSLKSDSISEEEAEATTAYEDASTNQRSGRRRKILEKFGNIWEPDDHPKQFRKSGGADGAQDQFTARLNLSRRRIRSGFNLADAYDRFRGTLQHTLARRETIQARTKRGTKRVYSPKVSTNMDTRRSNLLARLRYNNVPPSYRLLADFEIQKRPLLRTSIPPPPPPRDDATVSRQLQGRQCSICNRPVQRTSKVSRHSDTDSDSRAAFPVNDAISQPIPSLLQVDDVQQIPQSYNT